MRVLSLFDGCAGARQALDNLGIECEYYASEIDKYAIQIALKNYPDIIQLGDITKLDENNLPSDIDLLIGGSPCQSLSVAGRQKQSGLEAGKSVLFWEYIRVLNLVKPKYFVLENVASMKSTDRDKISEIIGVEPIMINSALVTAQSRKRYYWTNIANLQQPGNKGLVLNDILENVISSFADRDKSYCITATDQRANLKDYVISKQRQLIITNNLNKRLEDFSSHEQVIIGSSQKNAFIGLLTNKSSTLSTAMGLGGGQVPMVGNLYNSWRKLTPIECERLQGMKDNYTSGVSNTQRYKMIGNGFTIPVIEHILKHMEVQ